MRLILSCLLLSTPLIAAAKLPMTIGQTLYAPESSPDPDKPYVRLLVTQFAHPNDNEAVIARTVNAFKSEFGKNNFEARVYSGEVVHADHAELVLSSAGTYRRTVTSGARDLATVISAKHPDPNFAEGSLFLTLKSRDDINTLEDLKGKKLTATGFNAFSGLQTALGEIEYRGYDSDHFFSELIPTGYNMENELDRLLDGSADVAVVRTCFFEEIASKGRDMSIFKPVAVKAVTKPAGCLTSTDLYPNWTLFATPSATPEIARKASTVLLNMTPDAEGRRWGIASDFYHTDQLFKTIRRGPYEYLRTWTWKRFWQTQKEWILLALALTLGLAMHSVRASYLVRKRTEELSETHQKQVVAEQERSSAQTRLMSLQKAGAIGQMSSIIAHELRQPLSAVISYSHGLQRILESGRSDEDKIASGLELIEREAKKAESIVAKVRNYAKSTEPARKTISIRDLVVHCTETLGKTTKLSKITIEGENLKILADPLEAELAVINLLKNAVQVTAALPDGEIRVNMVRSDNRCVLSISDNGEKLEADVFAGITEPLYSDKTEGLGLGLSIVRLIAENHGGRLSMTQNEKRGLTATLSFPSAEKSIES